MTKRDGTTEEFSFDKLESIYKTINRGLNTHCSFSKLKENVATYLVPGMLTTDITKILIKSAKDLISTQTPDWQFVAGRLEMINLYKEASIEQDVAEEDLYTTKYFVDLVEDYVDKGLYHPQLMEKYNTGDLIEAANMIIPQTDMTYNSSTVMMYRKRYLLNPNGEVRELPQHMYLAVALFLAMPEEPEDRLPLAKKIYEYCSQAKISLPTPTLLNARTPKCQLSSCFELNVGDDLREIYHNLENMAQISKFGGGIGVYLGNVRSRGASIRGIRGAAGGVNPWIKIINDTAIAVNQLGARAGAISVTLDVFHRDIFQFLDLQTETGDIRGKAFDIFPSVSFPDLFFRRMEKGKEWTLFDPKEIEDLYGKRLQDHFGSDFVKFYEELEQDKRLMLSEKHQAKDIFKVFLKAVVETGMPYTFFRDTCNAANPNKHAGHIYHTNLCVEIQQNTSQGKFIEETLEDGQILIKYTPGDTVVCNLASINVAKVNTQEEIDKVLPVALAILDNVIDLNYYPIKEAEITSKKYRPVGLGFLGLAQHLAEEHLNYGSPESVEYVDKLWEKYAYTTLKASNELAKKKGPYELFEGSDFSKGIFNGRQMSHFEEGGREWQEFEDRRMKGDEGEVDVNPHYKAGGWIELQCNIEHYGTRFGYHLAPAPNSSTALVVGTTAGVLPIYKRFFTETNAIAPMINVAPGITPDNFWYYKEYTSLDMNGVIDLVSTIQKWVDQSISFEWLIDPAKTSPAVLYGYYIKSWKSGIKTIYYVRSQSLTIEGCDSCSG